MSITQTDKFEKFLKISLLFLLIITLLSSVPLVANAAKCKGCGENGCSIHCGKKCNIEHDPNTTDYCSLCGHIHPFDNIRGGLAGSAYDTVLKANSDIFNFQSGIENQTITCSGCKKELNSDVLYCPDCSTATANFEITTILKFDTNEPVFGAVFSAAESLYDSISLLGSIMVFVYFLLEIAEVQMNDGFTYESLTRHTLKTIAAFLIIRNGFTILELGIATCNDVLQGVLSSATSPIQKAFTANTCPYWDCSGKFLGMPLGAIGVFIYYAIPGIVMDVCFVILRVICWARVLDIMVRIILSPIGMSDFMHGGASSNGVKYFKKLLSSVLQGACIVATFMCYNELAGCIRGTVSGFLGVILLSLALLTMMKQTSGVANDIIGI